MIIIIIVLLVRIYLEFYYIQDYIRLQLNMKMEAWNMNWRITRLIS